MSSDIRKGRHCVSALHVHLVFVTKYRKKVFDTQILNSMNEILIKVCLKFEAELREFNGEDNHVHLVITYPPKYSVSILVNSLKGVSSRLLRQEFEKLRGKYWKGVLWSPSYFAGSCGGASLDILKSYIENQNRPN
jgi:putative transposase